jgi:hypothetical protein
MSNVVASCPSISSRVFQPRHWLTAFDQEVVVSFSFTNWLGQVTTGHGAMILGSTAIAVVSGSMAWQTAVPLVAAGIIGALWPENTRLQDAARTAAMDVDALVSAYRTGFGHGAETDTSALAAPVAAGGPRVTPVPAAAASPGGGVAVLAMLLASGLVVAGCATQTPAQQAATAGLIASGLVCLADASGKVVATASNNDPNAVKAVNAAVAAGSTLLTDSACQTALASGTAAMAAPVAAQP